MNYVMIRNVLIYFGEETKKQVLAKVARFLAADGYLILGGSETTLFANNLFERCCSVGSGAYALMRPKR
jgi:chemotaxis methyl-accepting protein methylase